MSMDRKILRGAIRGLFFRERSQVPGPTRAMLRRRRVRLLEIYCQRFGTDDFVAERSAARLGKPLRSAWLGRGYAHWRTRLAARPILPQECGAGGPPGQGGAMGRQ